MSNTLPPITSVQEFEDLLTGLKSSMDEEAWHKANMAIETLKDRGFPADPDSYTLNKVVAEDDKDLNLKMHLAAAPLTKQFVEQEISADELTEQLMPLLMALAEWMQNLAFTGEEATWPVTITVDTPENAD